jgi:hypothetical protein
MKSLNLVLPVKTWKGLCLQLPLVEPPPGWEPPRPLTEEDYTGPIIIRMCSTYQDIEVRKE